MDTTDTDNKLCHSNQELKQEDLLGELWKGATGRNLKQEKDQDENLTEKDDKKGTELFDEMYNVSQAMDEDSWRDRLEQ